MEEAKLQALADSLSGFGGHKGLGTSRGQYSWVKGAEPASGKGERKDGLPNNQLYSNFVKAGAYDPNGKEVDGDGREIKRDFSDIPVLEDDDKKTKKAQKKLEKKRLKMEAKKAAKLAEKKALKKASKKRRKDDEAEKHCAVEQNAKPDKKRKRKESEFDEASGNNKRKGKKVNVTDPTTKRDKREKKEKKKKEK